MRGTNPALYKPDMHMGQFKEVPILEEAIGPLKNGFFIEAGALNGIWFSNTLYFESAHNWTGMKEEACVFVNLPSHNLSCHNNRNLKIYKVSWSRPRGTTLNH